MLRFCVLTCRRLQGNTSRDQGKRFRDSQGLRKVTAVILTRYTKLVSDLKTTV